MNPKASLFFIFVTIALDSIGIGIIIPALPDVIRRFLTDEASISRTYGYFVALYALLQFVASPFLGRLSDRFGRRPVLLFSLLGGAVDYLFMAFAPTLPLLFLGRMISGISGASYTVASAYIADISTDENRAKNFGVIGAGFGIGFILGPAVGGLLASYGSYMPFVAAGLFNLLNFLFGLLVLPESLPPASRRPINYQAINPFGALFRVVSIPSIQVLLIIFVLVQMAGQTHPSIWTLYTEHRYGWSPAEVGLSLAAVGFFTAASEGGLTGVFVKKFGEMNVFIWGTLGEAISFFLFGLATKGWMIYATLSVSSFFWAAQPVLQSLISREVASDAQGELQGTLMSLMSLMGVINPLVMTALFSFTSDRASTFYVPGSPYLLSGAFLLIGFILALFHRAKSAAKQA